jgi:hypothetical protein
MVTSSLVATQSFARDNLAAAHHLKPTIKMASVKDVPGSHPEPFTMTRGTSGLVCSISGLGQTSRCTMRTWAERRGMSVLTASD